MYSIAKRVEAGAQNTITLHDSFASRFTPAYLSMYQGIRHRYAACRVTTDVFGIHRQQSVQPCLHCNSKTR